MPTNPTSEPEDTSSAGRPNEIEGLLSEAIGDGAFYPDWDFDHGAKRRFFVRGMSWFMRTSRIPDLKSLLKYREEARHIVSKETSWMNLPRAAKYWDEPLSYNQFRNVEHKKPAYLPKAAMILVCCELALRDQITKGEVKGDLSAEIIYKHMGIVPAVWSVQGLTPDTLNNLKNLDKSLLYNVARSSGQEEYLLDDLARGFTVTRETAESIAAKFNELLPENEYFTARARPSSRGLGSRNASSREQIDNL